ncbi:hypothetical protein BCV70DRAFT_202059 [Testicularia cyperi]|uniref:F-box domain-containing protein n=1 Tax=Testicularia cyperi TaxID=1882483 RepID=A0A317XLK9_9BASI|nr:hypothetical protein BCV70DRAFT_202059 [Testicularia cyperi]
MTSEREHGGAGSVQKPAANGNANRPVGSTSAPLTAKTGPPGAQTTTPTKRQPRTSLKSAKSPAASNGTSSSSRPATQGSARSLNQASEPAPPRASTASSASIEGAARNEPPNSGSPSGKAQLNGAGGASTPKGASHIGIDESTNTDDRDSLVSRIGFEPRSISGLPPPEQRTNEAIVWLDIDNTLYKRSTRIAELMAERIRAYFHGMGLSEGEAKSLHLTYYKTYGLAIRGLVKHHQIDPLDYDEKCDASLPLESILRPDPQVKRMLSEIDRTRVRVFALTNAYRYHADRCLRLLDLEDQVEGIVYCDYAVPDFACKPELDYYRAALLVVGAKPGTRHYFVDDSSLNVVAAKEMGWHSCIYFREEDDPEDVAKPVSQQDQDAAAKFQISALAARPGSDAQSLTVASSGGFDEQAIREQIQKLPSHQRIRLLGIILDACLPSDIAGMSRLLEKHLRKTRDVVSGLPDAVALRIFEKLPVQDLLRCRRVSKKWLSLASTPELWRSHALALTEGDPVRVEPPATPEGWEPLVKGLFFRERNWARGLAQSIQMFEGHTGFVTSMKLKGRKTLVSGSYDETIRVWDLSTGACRKVLRAKAISCLDFLEEQGVLCAGLYDTGRVMVWDMKTWDVIQTLSGHNRGIRNVAINSDYLVSVGQDKAIVVWDWRTGAKVVRFGQQSNVSLGVSLVDKDKLVAVTVDGMIRCFSIPRREMIGQYQLTRLGTPDLALGSRLGDLASGSSMLEWFAAHGNTLTVASKSLVVHLEWQEHVVPVKETGTQPLTAEGLRRSASSRMGNGLSPLRPRRDSTQSNNSTTVGSPLTPSSATAAAARARRDSNTSTTSSTSGIGAARSPRRSLAGATSGSGASARTGRSSLGGGTELSLPGLSTPSRPRGSPSIPSATKKAGLSHGPAPWPMVTDEDSSKTSGSASGTSTPTRAPRPGSTASLSFPSTPGTEPEAVGAAGPEGSAPGAAATRIAPNLSVAPRVTSVLETPDMATGCVDPAKRRIVASTRFSSRAGAERLLYTSSLPMDLGKTSAELVDVVAPPAQESADAAAGVVESRSATARGEDEPGSKVVPIGGAWAARAAELSVPTRNPMAMVLDHESVVVGCADGSVYRMHFVGSKYSQTADMRVAHTSDGKPIGDATITDLLQLREVWGDIFVPENQPDHPGRLKRDRLREMGLK